MSATKHDDTKSYKCPKCSGLTYTVQPAPGVNTNKCSLCGLHYEIGGNTEALKKQILVDNYVNPLGG